MVKIFFLLSTISALVYPQKVNDWIIYNLQQRKLLVWQAIAMENDETSSQV